MREQSVPEDSILVLQYKSLIDKTEPKGLGAEKYIHGYSPVDELDRLERQYTNFFNRVIWRNVNLSGIPSKGNQFLEIGCGVAAQTPTLLSLIPKEMKIIGIDIDPLKIARASEKLKRYEEYANRYSFHVMDASNLSSFPDNYFNGAYICWVLEHLTPETTQAVLKELRRVVIPGGLVLINEVIMESLAVQSLNECPALTKAFILSLVKMQSSLGGDANFGREKTMKEHLEKAGFTKFSYELKPFHILEDYKWQEDFQDWLIDCLDSVIPLLDSKGEFPKEDYEKVKEEISANNDIMLFYGRMTIENIK